MHDATLIKAIAGKYIELLDDLDERGRRRWAAVEARALGWGGITIVALATGLSDRTIRTGLKELDAPPHWMPPGNGVKEAAASPTRSPNRACATPWIG